MSRYQHTFKCLSVGEQEELTRILGSTNAPLARKEMGVTTILMCGLQGTGARKKKTPLEDD